MTYAPLLNALATYKRFRPFYRSAMFMQADKEICEFLDLPRGTPLPFTIPHGVLPPFSISAIDCYEIEPIYWAHSLSSYSLAKEIKPSVCLPHPWLFALGKVPQTSVRRKRKAIVVANPPSKDNDSLLLAQLADFDPSSVTILVKNYGAYAPLSLRFWRDNGFFSTYAISYQNLACLFASHEEALFPSLSSAIFFASTAGCLVRLIRECHYYDYEFVSSLELDFAVARLHALRKPWLDIIAACEDPGKLLFLSGIALGSDFLASPLEISLTLYAAIQSVDQPLYYPPSRSRSFKRAFAKLLPMLGLAGLYQQLFPSRIKMRKALSFRGQSFLNLALIQHPSINQFVDLVPDEILAKDCLLSKGALHGVGANRP